MNEVSVADRSSCRHPHRKRNGSVGGCWPTGERLAMPNDSGGCWRVEGLNTGACDDEAFLGMAQRLCTWHVFEDRYWKCRVEGTIRKADFLIDKNRMVWMSKSLPKTIPN